MSEAAKATYFAAFAWLQQLRLTFSQIACAKSAFACRFSGFGSVTFMTRPLSVNTNRA